MSSNDEGSTLMVDNTKQTHANKQSQLFQPGSPSKRKNNHTRNMNMNMNISINSPNRRKRKQPRSRPRQSQHQLSPNETDKHNQQNNTDHTSNTSNISKQDNSNNNDWQFNYDHDKNKNITQILTSNSQKDNTPSFGKFYASPTAKNEKNKKDENMNKDHSKPDSNDMNMNDMNMNDMNMNDMNMNDMNDMNMNEYNVLADNKNDNNNEIIIDNNNNAMSNLLQSQYSLNDNNRAPFIEEQLSGIFDALDNEICAVVNNNNSDDGLDDIDDVHNDDYKLQHMQYKPQQRKTKKPVQSRRDCMETPQSQKIKSKYNTPISDIDEYNKPLCVHPSGKKISDESFKLIQKCLNGLEKAKHIRGQTNAMQQLSKIQQSICKTVERKHKHKQNEYKNNDSDEEKMSMDNINVSPSYSPNSIQSPREPQQYQYQYRKQQKSSKKKAAKHKYYNTNYNQTGNMSHNNNSITNIIIHDVRKQLSFCSSTKENNNNTALLAPQIYEYGMSSPQIIQKQKQKICRTNQEMDDLHKELNCVYNLLDVVRGNRNKLSEDLKSSRKEHRQQIKSIHKQYYQFKQQTKLFEKEKKEIEHDIQQQKQYQHDINVSPVKSPRKSNRRQRYSKYK